MDAFTSEFNRWFAGSRVVDEQGKPLVVYRGEHGETDQLMHSRLGSISFGSAETAATYSITPNNRCDIVARPRINAAYLSIRNPVIENRGDPFIDMKQLAAAIGCERMFQIAREMRDQIACTDRWMEELGKRFKTPLEFLQNNADAWDELYLNAYVIFDSPEYVGWFRARGFDGAIHMGNGESALEQEYKAFDLNQIKWATARGSRHVCPDSGRRYAVERVV